MYRLTKGLLPKDTTLGVMYLLYPQGNGYSKSRPLNYLKKMLACIDCRRYLVVIDNSAQPDYRKIVDADEHEIGGDNSLREFSGWQKGLNYLREIGKRCDAYLFVNDTFLHKSFGDRRLFHADSINCTITQKAMVGKLMPPPRGDVLGNLIPQYVRTHFFLMEHSITDRLKNLVSLDQSSLKHIFLDAYDPRVPLFNPQAPVAESLREYLFSHLTTKWHRKQDYSKETFENLRGKAAAVLNSLLLSARVGELGFPLISFDDARKIARGTSVGQRVLNPPAAANRTAEGAVNYWQTAATRYQHVSRQKRIDNWAALFTVLRGKGPEPDHF